MNGLVGGFGGFALLDVDDNPYNDSNDDDQYQHHQPDWADEDGLL